MVISHNLLAMNANRQLGMVTGDSAKNTEKLSSGYKINRAADDAAGLSISEKMRKQIRGLTRASENSQDGVSFVQIADGALAEVHDMLDRMVELTVQAANGTNSTSDRAAIQKEIDQLTTEINRIQETTKFNETQIFTEKGHSPDEGVLFSNVISADTVKVGDSTYTFEFIGTDGSAVTTADTTATGKINAGLNQDFADFVVGAASNAVSKIANAYPALTTASSDVKVGLNVARIDGPSGTLASAELSMKWSSSYTQMSYTLNIDSADFDPNKPLTADQKEKLASTIAHEMTHLMMQDTLTPGMTNAGNFPLWFVEGTAQTSSGDNGWVAYDKTGIGLSPSESAIKNYMKNLESVPYGTGYLGVMALGLEVASREGLGGATVAEKVRKGINALFADLIADGQSMSLSDSIAHKTRFTSLADFQNQFKNAEMGLFNNVKDILDEKNAGGNGRSGSVFENDLGISRSTTFANTPAVAGQNYGVDKTVTKVANSFGSGFPIPPAPVTGARHGVTDGGDDILIHAGTDADLTNKIAIKRYDISSEAIFDGDKVDVMTEDSATNSIRIVGAAKDRVSRVRSYYGAMQNRLEHTIKNLDNVVENTQAAESQIRDTDMAKEMVKYTKNNILQQAGQSMLAQANQSTQGVMNLLQ